VFEGEEEEEEEERVDKMLWLLDNPFR
jgi:hypothetical protein